jgi:sugar transferase (PEP-CTERM system associated)
MLHIFNRYVSAKSLLLILVEALIIAMSLLCAVKLRFWNDSAEMASYLGWPDFAVQIAIVILVCQVCFYYNDLYDLSATRTAAESVLRIEESIGAATLLLGLFYFLVPSLLLSRGVLLIGMVLVAGLVIVSRKALDKAWQLTAPLHTVVILGTGRMAMDLARELTRRGDLSMKLEGFIAPASAEKSTSLFGFPVLGSTAELEKIADDRHVSRIIVALEDRRGTLPTRELVTLRVKGIRVDDAPTALSALTGRISLDAVRPSWVVFSDGFHRSRWNEVLKRVLDLTVAITALLISLPILILVWAAVRLDSKGSAIYRQVRVGRKGMVFEVWKFRSMRADAEQDAGAQWAVENDPRITRVGRILRKYRLDELPQFINVIRGEMSFVGPRPERPEFVQELRKHIAYYDERHSVRPGITGWAQVRYRYGSTIEDSARKLEYDFFYLKNMSILFDCAILFDTVRVVLFGFGSR